MKKLTTEQLLFAHRIGATHSRNEWSEGLFSDVGDDSYKYWNTSVNGWVKAGSPNFKYIEKIDFTPLYNTWIDHDGGECPVRPFDMVEVREKGRQVSKLFVTAKTVENWADVMEFKIHKCKGWPEQHAETPETEHSTAHHKRPDGSDLIDDWWNDYPPEMARVLMWEQVRKYQNRLGKKDQVQIEVAKMADYMARWAEKEQELTLK